MLNIDANTGLDIEFDTGVINYFQIDSAVNVSFDVGQYSDTELTVYLYPEINFDANKQLLISAVIGLGLYVPICNIFLLRMLDRGFRVRRFAQRFDNVMISLSLLFSFE